MIFAELVRIGMSFLKPFTSNTGRRIFELNCGKQREVGFAKTHLLRSTFADFVSLTNSRIVEFAGGENFQFCA